MQEQARQQQAHPLPLVPLLLQAQVRAPQQQGPEQGLDLLPLPLLLLDLLLRQQAQLLRAWRQVAHVGNVTTLRHGLQLPGCCNHAEWSRNGSMRLPLTTSSLAVAVVGILARRNGTCTQHQKR